MRDTRIGRGEAEALVIAKEKKLLAILDDREARALAKSWGVEYQGTAMVLFEAFTKGKINYDELIESLTQLSKVSRLSSDVIAEIIKRAKEVRR